MKKSYLYPIYRVVNAIQTVVNAIKSKTDNLPASPADQITSLAIKSKTDNLPASPANEVTLLVVAADAAFTEEHFHNREYWFGKLAVQTATNWGERASVSPYRAISGDNDFGSDVNDEAQVIGSADTPVREGSTTFDLRRVQVIDVSVASVYLIRIIHGTGTMADAEAAGQYTEVSSLQVTAPNGQAKPVDMFQERVSVGDKIWIRAKNATDNAWIDFLVGLHEYPAPGH